MLSFQKSTKLTLQANRMRPTVHIIWRDDDVRPAFHLLVQSVVRPRRQATSRTEGLILTFLIKALDHSRGSQAEPLLPSLVTTVLATAMKNRFLSNIKVVPTIRCILNPSSGINYMFGLLSPTQISSSFRCFMSILVLPLGPTICNHLISSMACDFQRGLASFITNALNFDDLLSTLV